MKRLALLLLLIALPCAGFAQQGTEIDPRKDAIIRETLEVTGAFDLGRQMMARMTELEKQGKSKQVQDAIDRLAARMDPAELVDEIVVIYDRHFTLAELTDILAFYKSETGRKMLAEMPALLKESMDLGADWSQRKAQELRQELESGTTLQ